MVKIIVDGEMNKQCFREQFTLTLISKYARGALLPLYLCTQIFVLLFLKLIVKKRTFDKTLVQTFVIESVSWNFT